MTEFRNDGQAKSSQREDGLLVGVFYTSYAILTVEIARSRDALFRILADWTLDQAPRKLPVGVVKHLSQLCQEGEGERAVRYYQEQVSSAWDEEQLHIEQIGVSEQAASAE